MLTKDETIAIDTVLSAAEEGIKEMENHPEYSAIQQGAAAGVGISRLPNRYRITASVIEALRERIMDEDSSVDPTDPAQVASPDEIADRVFAAIEHGSEPHREWLRAALHAFYNGESIPAADAPVTPAVQFEISAAAAALLRVDGKADGGSYIDLNDATKKSMAEAPADDKKEEKSGK